MRSWGQRQIDAASAGQRPVLFFQETERLKKKNIFNKKTCQTGAVFMESMYSLFPFVYVTLKRFECLL